MTDTVYTEAQRLAISESLERLVLSSHFRQSKRFPSFLRFIIREELAGRGDLLKERTLGVEVFGRVAGYDTTSDPIVRVTAAEIRKRLAQYYQDHGQDHTQEHGPRDEVHFSLPPGSYVPHFEWPCSSKAVQDVTGRPMPAPADAEHPLQGIGSTQEVVPAGLHGCETVVRSTRRPRWMRGRFAVSALACLLLLACLWVLQTHRRSALDRFWDPVFQPDTTVILCFPRYQVDTMYLRSASDPEHVTRFTESTQAVNGDDLNPLVSLTGLLQQRNQPFLLMGQDAANLTDLRRGPGIFIGAFDNAWALRATNGLRFRFGNDATMQRFWIEDTQGAHRRWQIDRSQQVATNNYKDYAIVARFHDSSTGQISVVAAGIARGGTIAAGEFLTEPDDIGQIRQAAAGRWDENIEVVLSTEIIDGRSAPPRIEATYFW